MKAIGGREFDSKEVLWKYFRPERLIEALATMQLHFASANQFSDSFEGAVAVQIEPVNPDPRYAELESAEKAFFELKRLTKISCWHRAAYESDAMWKLYAAENKGIVLCTTPERLGVAVKPFRLKPEYAEETLWAGSVEYVDLTRVRLQQTGMLGRFFIKHRAFEWEREFRLAISLREAEEAGVRVPANGIFVEIDLDVLVERVVLGATMTVDERRAAIEAIEGAGLLGRLSTSTLLGRPRFF